MTFGTILIIFMINVRVFNLIAYIYDSVDLGAITLLGTVTLGLFNNAIICDNYYNDASSTKWWL